MFEMMSLMFALTGFYMYTFLFSIWLFPFFGLIVSALVSIVIYFYLFLVVYSNYRIFRKEYERKLEQETHEIITQV